MEILYNPNLGLTINGSTITWKMDRQKARDLLKSSYEEDNQTFDMSEFFDRDEDNFDFSLNRDIYSGLTSEGDSIFMCYDKDDAFTQFEMHENIYVLIADFRIYQDQPIAEILNWVTSQDYAVTEVEPGNYAVAELKISFASHDAMGGNGDGLSYFYASNDISHLID
ncbi:hypothetical protein [Flavobacterium selenitireducens]|uniref:hypothetical protein n=1 Tax=Flavobacterium selenitireducens TaxID=2722704 RepID=UPI00168BFA12|nr:hypothetical protein [Flavobacterium selenitireducens]MBD3581642.1 hypothetical protein [Flavobacterium selenitireducens]